MYSDRVLFRHHSYKAENEDIMNRCSWSSDPILLWEHHISQVLKVGALRPKKGKSIKQLKVLPMDLELEEKEEEYCEEEMDMSV